MEADTLQVVINAIGGILVALLAWVGKRIHDRMDSFDNRLQEKVSKHDFDRIVDKIEERFDQALDRQTKLIVQLFKGRGLDD